MSLEVLNLWGALAIVSKTFLTFGNSGEVQEDRLRPLPPVPLSKIVGIAPAVEEDGELFLLNDPNRNDLVKGFKRRSVEDLESDVDGAEASLFFASKREVTSLSRSSRSAFLEFRLEGPGLLLLEDDDIGSLSDN